MSTRSLKRSCCVAVLLVSAPLLGMRTAPAADERPVDYRREIRPILSNNCYQCHGPDDRQRQGDLRLDVEQAAKQKRESSGPAIVPGDPDASLLIQRVTAEDELLRMPPPDSGKKLTARQIELLKKWIEQGAEWKPHWSFVPPRRPELPQLKRDEPGLSPIDYFIRARLEEEGLDPSPEADKETLIRRVTFDLTGLPPTLEEIDNFLADDSPNAYEKVVDRLLNSPHYGEHMARYWLDYARYGDTHGLHLDNQRSIWPYRDWVIKAFNDNLPFDQFTIWQLAGDLLPEATLEQKVATGFNRCNVTTSEGGAIAEEFRVRYAIDRVETMGTVFLGLTVGCAVCHEHKFDPISQTEFYQFFAYYNNAADPPMDGNALLTPPIVKVPNQQQKQQMASLRKELSDLQGRIREQLAKVEYTDPGPD